MIDPDSKAEVAMVRRALIVAATLVMLVIGVRAARAAWPTDGVRTISGKACTPFVNAIDAFNSYCPYVSDYINGSDSFYAPDNAAGIYVDFNVSATSSGAQTRASACRQRWTGASVSCGTPTTSSGTGYHDLGAYSFSTIGGTFDNSDYYYLLLATTETVNAIYGVTYF